jgi:pimeloyl-ACP methyl ester carboxylesterase
MKRLILISILILLSWPAVRSAAQNQEQALPESRYIRNTHSDKVIIFVHGFLGDSVSTWTNGGAYRPKMIIDDPDFEGFDVFIYQYPTGISANLTPDQVADDMRAVLKSYGVSERHQLSFVSHSMGGIVTRAYILKNRDISDKIHMLQFYSTPTNGSSLASIGVLAAHLANLSSSQIDKLTNDIEKNYLGDQTRAWQAAGFNIPSYCAYEELPTFGFQVVNFEAQRRCATRLQQALRRITSTTLSRRLYSHNLI